MVGGVTIERYPAYGAVLLLSLFLASCAADLGYSKIPIPDRRLNLSGLTAISTHYLDEHPDEFYTFHRMLTDANDALGSHEVITRAGVMRWIHRTAGKEGYDERMPVYLFLRTVYLNGWEASWFSRVGPSDREYLYDLISAVMGGMHLCTTCSTARDEERGGSGPDVNQGRER